jgi:hypothetical protein
MINSIGEFQFITVLGHPVGPREQPEVIARSGVDDVGVWRTGKRGEPFELVSQVDVASMDGARRLFKQYVDSIGQDPVVLIQDDYDYSAEGWKVVVLDVEERQRHAIISAVGGLNLPSLAFLECAWKLVAIQNSSSYLERA